MSTHPATLSIAELLKNCTEKHVRRSGPGGQNRNKVETGVVLRHVPTGVTAEASERRSQGENRLVAVRRLRTTLAVEIRSSAVDDGPSPLWKSRVRGGKLVLSDEHDDYPAMLAEALDELAASDWDVARAAAQIMVTTSQLVKLVKTEARAFRLLNQARAERGLSPLR